MSNEIIEAIDRYDADFNRLANIARNLQHEVVRLHRVIRGLEGANKDLTDKMLSMRRFFECTEVLGITEHHGDDMLARISFAEYQKALETLSINEKGEVE